VSALEIILIRIEVGLAMVFIPMPTPNSRGGEFAEGRQSSRQPAGVKRLKAYWLAACWVAACTAWA
ncbi:MAG: hypothetical protein ACXWKQ_21775, partial [Reyranella sp.]